MAKVLVVLIRGYQYGISPLLSAILGPSCRFTPSCSQYAIEAVERYGVIRGIGYAIWRVARCHSYSRGGYDPVP
ncbi:MAG TPA: membrane protein insertion efficiency factor YidD [Candidatus Hydrogenedentes bacterium]|nr:membrane protein insertion efficiency factor YidD [Candidatus Hydrogenedentota bacterium]